jgi:hypothetical protein
MVKVSITPDSQMTSPPPKDSKSTRGCSASKGTKHGMLPVAVILVTGFAIAIVKFRTS